VRRFLGALKRQAFEAILIYRIFEVPLYRERWTNEMLPDVDMSSGSE
jgi:hypothetical protein